MLRMLIVLTSHATLGDTGRPTGFHWEELATPYWIFRDAGIDVELASIAGGPVPHDPSSLKAEVAANKPSVERFVQDAAAMAALRDARPISEADAARYDGVFLPGGHGTMWDLPESAALAALIGTMFDDGRAVAAVCHGPAGLVRARRADGRPIVQGRRVNSFTDAEEAAIDLTAVMPFLLESRLRELGAIFESGPNFQPYAVRDANLVTGQNPASAEAVARHVVEVVQARLADVPLPGSNEGASLADRAADPARGASRRALLTAIPVAGLGLAMPAVLRASSPRRVLAISTSVARQPDGRPTGLWMAELTTPYWAFIDAGFEVQLASIAGGRPPVDPRSMTGPRGRGASVERFEAAPGAMAQFTDTPALQPGSGDGFDAVFLAGGHGTMWDFRGNVNLRTVVERAFRRGAVVAAVCHGPAGLLDATDSQGHSILRGRRATGFTNAEEDAVELTAAMPYLLEDEMRRLGARFEAAPNFAPFAVQDGNLITGQNPASAAPIGEMIVAALRARTGASG